MPLETEAIGKLIGRLTQTVQTPILVGRLLQILSCSEKSEAARAEEAVRMYNDPTIARLGTPSVAEAFAFFTGLSEGYAFHMASAIHRELVPAQSDRRPVEGMRTAPNFYHGSMVGFLQGVAGSEGYSEVTQRHFGHELIQIVRFDESDEERHHDCFGEISDAVAKIFNKYPFLCSEFYASMCRCPGNWVVGAYAIRICDCFLHKTLSIKELSLKDRATAVKQLHDSVRISKK